MKRATIQPALQPISSGNDLILKASAAERSLALLIMRQQRRFITRRFAGSRLSILSLTVPLLFAWQWATPGLQTYIEVLQVSVKRRDRPREKHLPGTSPQTYSWAPFVVDASVADADAVSRHGGGLRHNRVSFLIAVLIQFGGKGIR